MYISLSEILSMAAGSGSRINDLSNLEAPEPMERILSAGAKLGPDDVYLARLPHTPFPLLPLLESRELDWKMHEEEDGCVLILIRRSS